MHVGELESILLFVSDLNAAKSFYIDLLVLPVIFEVVRFSFLVPPGWAAVPSLSEKK